MATRLVLPFADVGKGITPSAGAFLFFFATGTSTPKDTWSGAAETEPNRNENPVESDSNGLFPSIFISGSYKVRLTDKNLVQIWEEDPVVSFATTESTGGILDILLTVDIATETRSPDEFVTTFYDGENTADSGASWVKTGDTGTPGTIDFDTLSIINAAGDLYLYNETVLDVAKIGAASSTVSSATASAQSAFTQSLIKTIHFSGSNRIYTFNAAIVVPSDRVNYVVTGDSPSTILRNTTTNILSMKTTFGTRFRNWRFTNIGFDGNGSNVGLDWESVHESVVEFVTFTNLAQGVRPHACFSNTFRNNNFKNCVTGIEPDELTTVSGSFNVSRIHDNLFEDCTFGLDFIENGNLNAIWQNEFKRCVTPIRTQTGGLQLIIEKNFFEATTGTEIELESSAAFPVNSVLISENSFGKADETNVDFFRITVKGVEDPRIFNNEFKNSLRDDTIIQILAINNKLLLVDNDVIGCRWAGNKITDDNTLATIADKEAVISMEGSFCEVDFVQDVDTVNLITASNELVSPISGWAKNTGGGSTLTIETVDLSNPDFHGALPYYHINAIRPTVGDPNMTHTLTLSALGAGKYLTFTIVAFGTPGDQMRISLRDQAAGGLGNSALITLTDIPTIYHVTSFFFSGEVPQALLYPGNTSPAEVFNNKMFWYVGSVIDGKAPDNIEGLSFSSGVQRIPGQMITRPDGTNNILSTSDVDALTITAARLASF